MKNRKQVRLVERQTTVAISISDSPDLEVLGMSERHLKGAMDTVATYLLSSGFRLAYGGDLRIGGFTEQLFELVSRYDPNFQSDGPAAVTNYLPWSACMNLTHDDYLNTTKNLGNAAEIKFLDSDGTVMEKFKFPNAPLQDKQEIAHSLTSMRKTMLEETEARVVLGGKVKGFQGSMPGIAEEALLSLQAGKPLYLLGGFGGCARDISESLNLIEPLHNPPRTDWDGYDKFSKFSVSTLNNGLLPEENRSLAKTPHIQQAVALVLRGLERELHASNE